jgi:AcrR family transcriptional regulator
MMESAQRDRLLWAMMAELEDKGYRDARIEGPIESAGLSIEEFAAEFGDKDSCLFAAYDRLTDRVLERAQPQLARAMTRSFPGIRPATYERYVELLERFRPFMSEGREYSGVDEELPGEVELLAVGAAEAIIFTEVDAGRAERLPAMMPEILFSVLVPFMGPDRAADEMRSAAAA